jgi:hypothetical protein
MCASAGYVDPKNVVLNLLRFPGHSRQRAERTMMMPAMMQTSAHIFTLTAGRGYVNASQESTDLFKVAHVSFVTYKSIP